MNLTFLRSPHQRPAGLSFAMVYMIGCVLITPAFVDMATGRVPMMYHDRPLAGPAVELFGRVILLMVPGPAAVLAWGLWRERAWTRPALLVWWVVQSATMAVLWKSLPPGPGVMGMLGVLVYAPVFWWYLYRKRTVVEYYASLHPAR